MLAILLLTTSCGTQRLVNRYNRIADKLSERGIELRDTIIVRERKELIRGIDFDIVAPVTFEPKKVEINGISVTTQVIRDSIYLTVYKPDSFLVVNDTTIYKDRPVLVPCEGLINWNHFKWWQWVLIGLGILILLLILVLIKRI